MPKLITEDEKEDLIKDSKAKFRAIALKHGYISVNLHHDVTAYHHPTDGHVIVTDHHTFFNAPNSNGTYGKYNISKHKSKDLESIELGYGHDDFDKALTRLHKK